MWEDAEAQVKRTTFKPDPSVIRSNNHPLTVSVKTPQPLSSGKRKETAEDIYKEEIGNREAKRARKGMQKAGKGVKV